MKKVILLYSFLLFLFSCARVEDAGVKRPEGYGIVSLRVSCDATKSGMDEATLSEIDEQALLQSAKVNIYYADFSGLVRSYAYSELPETIYLPANSYRVDVVAGEMTQANPQNPSWTEKSYSGSTEFTVEPSLVKTVQVEARCCNAISKVIFAPSVVENFVEGYKLTIQIDSLGAQYSYAENEKEAYFLLQGLDEPSLTWNFEGVLAKGNVPFSKQGTIPLVEAGKCYELYLKYTVKHGDLGFDLEVDYSEELFDDVVVFEPVSTGLSPSADYEIWAAHAIVHADVDQAAYSDPSEVRFEYSRDQQTWTSCAAQKMDDGTFQAELSKLTPSTTYAYRLVVKDEVIGDPLTFQTDEAPVVPNAGLETTSSTGSYYEWYNSGASDATARSPWWGTGNGSHYMNIDGSADMGYVICAPDASTKVEGSQSACLSSCWAVVKFAAGNLFTGYFGGLIGTKGGIVYYGRPFTGRPSALRVSLKYSTGKINRVDGYPANDPVSTNDYDRARAFVALGDWDYQDYGGTKDCPILVNTTNKSTFYDYKTMDGTIAFGEVILTGDSSNSHNKWVEYTIKLDYNSLVKIPEYIIISFASSMLGDYFTGSESSKLWVDDMELIYE